MNVTHSASEVACRPHYAHMVPTNHCAVGAGYTRHTNVLVNLLPGFSLQKYLVQIPQDPQRLHRQSTCFSSLFPRSVPKCLVSFRTTRPWLRAPQSLRQAVDVRNLMRGGWEQWHLLYPVKKMRPSRISYVRTPRGVGNIR